ncbi:hypothetical protein FGO68_gene2532 [Halteria grandinella]|uniref:Uncharacterized protein n=1 Tax=Halteria grandinella TaxID=5974 RepID=A0A8J8P5L6_HALGN|nr:hypothetical protein FGO68_gene2532 [Halteria grandinella]
MERSILQDHAPIFRNADQETNVAYFLHLNFVVNIIIWLSALSCRSFISVIYNSITFYYQYTIITYLNNLNPLYLSKTSIIIHVTLNAFLTSQITNAVTSLHQKGQFLPKFILGHKFSQSVQF